ncbi:hypothetical protein FQR65_LT16196 [Abscondita terminalis]|nr:hypothetical protein FQR65_LT16196 [Abscondita terminalis]
MDRKRVNYTSDEKNLLVTLVDKYKDKVENKKTNGISNKEKEAIWASIADEFNSKALNVYRDSNALRKQWANYKQDARKAAAKQRHSLYKTGGGPGEVTDTSKDEVILSIISDKTVKGLEQEFDSDVLPVVLSQDETDSYDVTILEISNSDTNAPSTSNIATTAEVTETQVPSKNLNSRRRPNIKLSVVEAAKLEVLQIQKQLLEAEMKHKEKLWNLELNQQEKLFEVRLRHIRIAQIRFGT